jgi:hypothetical protein
MSGHSMKKRTSWNLKHGLSHNSGAYNSWGMMRYRILNKNGAQFHDYGGRGIKICKRWMNFENFYEDMGERPPGMTLDRIDNNGNYCPSNCRWTTKKKQNNNSRRNVMLTHGGKTQTLTQWAIELKVSPWRLFGRRRRGLPAHLILTQPKGKHVTSNPLKNR